MLSGGDRAALVAELELDQEHDAGELGGDGCAALVADRRRRYRRTTQRSWR
jgi:hypothetical protein